MSGMFDRCRRWIVTLALWFRRKPVPLKRAKRQSTDYEQSVGSHYYFGDLLDSLDGYFADIDRMKRYSPEMYGYFRKVGAQVLPREQRLITTEELPATWLDGSRRPSQGMWHSNYDRDNPEMCRVAFSHYMKYSKRVHVEHSNHDIFELNMMYRWKKKYLACGSFHVSVDPAGQITLLRECRALIENMPTKNHRRRSWYQNGYFQSTLAGGGPVRHVKWDYPAWLADFSVERNKRNREEPHEAGDIVWDGDLDIHQHAAMLFCLTVSAVSHSVDGLQVMVTKDNRTARFNISMLRTPYFFADRDKSFTVNGATKRIFHIVRAHGRVMAGGQVKWVKSHFRGERRFTWKGYRVLITMPGYHHAPVDAFDGAAIEDDGTPFDLAKELTLPQVGEEIARHMRREPRHGARQ
jgi:hypothetical protein